MSNKTQNHTIDDEILDLNQDNIPTETYELHETEGAPVSAAKNTKSDSTAQAPAAAKAPAAVNATTNASAPAQSSTPAKQSGKKKKKTFRINIHMILLALSVIIIGVGIVKLMQWNKGEIIEIDPEADTSEFDVEVLDSIMPLAPNLSEGHVYDDETTVLFLGNNFAFHGIEDGASVPDKVAVLTGYNVINAAFPNSSLASKNLNFIEQNYPDDVFTLPYITDALISGNFDQLESIRATYRADGNWSEDAVATLKTLDLNKIDVIAIMYDAQDYLWLRGLENPLDPVERCTFVGALRYSIQQIQANFPYIRIIVMSPTYAVGFYEDGSTFDTDVQDLGNGKLSTYLIKEIDVCADRSVSIVDNFYGSINQDNYRDYLEENGIDVNDRGRNILAKRFVEALNKYPVGN